MATSSLLLIADLQRICIWWILFRGMTVIRCIGFRIAIPLVRYLLPGNILQGKRFLVHLWNGEVNFNNFVQGTWIWCQRLIPLCSSTSEFLLLGAVRLHQPDQVKHYLFGGVRSFITITGDSGFLFTLLRTRFWTCNFLFRILSSVLHLIYVNAGNFFWRDFLSTAF